MRIPRKIHQTFSHPQRLPEDLIENSGKIRAINPDHEYTLFGDSDRIDFIATYYDREVLNSYLSINKEYGSARADFFKFLLIYHEGGIYLDIKSGASRAFSDVILPSDAYLLAQWDNSPTGKFPGFGLHKELIPVLDGGEYVTWFLIAEPRHPFIEKTIEIVMHRIKTYTVFTRRGPAKQVMFTTGPIAYTQAIEPIRGEHEHRLVDPSVDLGLSYTIYDGIYDHCSRYPTYRLNTKPLVNRNPLWNMLYPSFVRVVRHWQWR